ncbi:MAG: peptide ABC transporter substrate-binding protein [Armatimonadota bacterium]|nr:peptide ABC transporter substrate-binding protein [Armatimonadota bacterium]
MTRSRLPRALALVAVVALALGLGVPGAGAQPRRDTVVIGMAQEPDGLIMDFWSMAAGRAVTNSVFTDMVGYNDKWELIPGTVQKIPTLKDGDWQLLPGNKMKVTFKLKRGFTWHDGRPYTALDVSWTYLMLRNPRTPTVSRFVLRKIDNVLAPDPYTVVVQWNERYPFANVNPIGASLIYPRHVMERDYLRDPASLRNNRMARAPIGNGPYKFVEWVPGSHITLEAYDKYPEGPPKIRRQVWRFILDSTVLQANVIANQVDVTETNNFSLEQMLEIERRNPQQKTYYTPALIWEHIDLNLDNEWLKDKRVRQALAHAINREELSQKLFYGKQPVAHTWLPERHEGYNAAVRKYAYDPARARQLLAEAGFTPGPDGILRDSRGQRVEMSIMTTAGNAVREQIQQILKEQLRAVGIDLRIDNRPASVLFGQVTARRQFPHMVMYAWLQQPITTGYTLWHSSQIPSAQNNWEGQNYPGWRNAENDRLLEQINTEIDAAKRVQLLKRQQEIWVDELPSIPLYFRLALNTAHARLSPIKPTGLSGTYINWNSKDWVWSQ